MQDLEAEFDSCMVYFEHVTLGQLCKHEDVNNDMIVLLLMLPSYFVDVCLNGNLSYSLAFTVK